MRLGQSQDAGAPQIVVHFVRRRPSAGWQRQKILQDKDKGRHAMENIESSVLTDSLKRRIHLQRFLQGVCCLNDMTCKWRLKRDLRGLDNDANDA